MKTFLLALLITLVSGPLNPLTTAANAAQSVHTTDTDQPLHSELVFTAKPLKTMTEIPFRVDFGADREQTALLQSAVCSLTMPAMPMPENHPELQCEESHCTGTAVFTMAGAWRATFDLTMQDGTTPSITIDIDRVRMK